MNLVDILENRMTELFEGKRLKTPFPFKKLAKQATREMKRNAQQTGDAAIAPSLYTILINPTDDAVIAPIYQQVTDELVDFLTHEARNAGLTVAVSPMVRFIADGNVRQGKLEVIAEVVESEILEEVRLEEAKYTEAHMRAAGSAPVPRQQKSQVAMPDQRQSARPASPQPSAQQQVVPQVPQQNKPSVQQNAPSGFTAGEAPVQVPITTSGMPAQPQKPVQTPDQPENYVCEFVDTTNPNRVLRITKDVAVIGRESTMADIVLQDTNVSRRHAEVTHDLTGWHIRDLGSTNGTRVNGSRVQGIYDLRSGDIVQCGLIKLAFREL
ncbi:MAG: DUF3662 domain-containing protein [Coriobacteriales bacterium]|nr:DUF3662 domain-containing protein [Coriobacteriales bacterium]